MTNRGHTYFQLDENGGRIPAEQDRIDRLKALQLNTYERLQDSIGTEVPSGVPIDEIEQYFTDMNTQTSPMIVFDSSDPQAQAVLRDIAPWVAKDFDETPGLRGSYSGAYDITFVAKDRCVQYGASRTNCLTRTIVHEYGHSTAKGETRITPRGDAQNSFSLSSGYASGFLNAKGEAVLRGHSLNEAHAGLYESHFVPSEGQLGTPAGIFEGDVLIAHGIPVPHDMLTPLNSYLSTTSASTHVTVAVELLAIRDPELIQLVLEGGSSAVKEQELLEHLNALEREYPGLTDILLGPGSNSLEDLAAAGQAIVKYFPNARDLVMLAHEQAREIVQRTIATNRQRREEAQVSSTNVRESILLTRTDARDIASFKLEITSLAEALEMANPSVSTSLKGILELVVEARSDFESVAIAGNDNSETAMRAFDEALARLGSLAEGITRSVKEIEKWQKTL